MTLKDETFCFISDVKEKKSTANSARHRRTHAGKSGRVKLPSDYLTGKELKAMNGEVKTYRLNDPLSWGDFKELPDDLKTAYIKQIREKYNIPDYKLAEAMGIGKQTMIFEVRRLGLSKGKSGGGRIVWDEKAFYAWLCGVKAEETHTEAECAVPENDIHVFAKEEQPEASPGNHIAAVGKMDHKPAIPVSGELTFSGSAEAALNTASVLLGGANVRITIAWEVMPEEMSASHE